MRMSHWTDTEESHIIAELCRRSAVDPEFRTLALKDAAGAIAKVTTKSAPPDVSYRFVDNSSGVKTFALPDPIPQTEELADYELEQVAGGDDFTSTAGYTP
jgi:hypothetical protein